MKTRIKKTRGTDAYTVQVKADGANTWKTADPGILASLAVESRSITVPDCIEQWAEWMDTIGRSPNTIHSGVSVLKHWTRHQKLSRRTVARIEEKHIDPFVNARDGAKLSQRQSRLTCIKRLMDFSIAKGYALRNPASLIRVKMKLLSHRQREPRKIRPITLAEYRRIMKNSEGFYHIATGLSYWTGLRLGDICQLEWDCFQPGEIIVWTDKRDTRVALPIKDPLIGSNDLMDTLRKLEQHHPQYCFPQERLIINDPSRRSRISVYYGRLLAGLGIEGKSFHSLRHAAITRWKRAGKSLKEIGRLVAHADESTTQGYVHDETTEAKTPS